LNPEQLDSELARYRRGKVPRELRRRQLLARAHDLFVEVGYDRASMDELAKRVGVSKPVIYDLCGSKEQLFRDVMAVVNAELAECVASAVTAEKTFSAKLHAGVLAVLRFIQQRREAWASLLATDAGPVGAEEASMQRQQAELVAALIAGGVDPSGTPANPLTAQVLASAINGAVEFVALWWQQHPDIAPEALADLLTRAFSPDLLELSALELKTV